MESVDIDNVDKVTDYGHQSMETRDQRDKGLVEASLELMQSDVHGYVQQELALLRECAPASMDQKKFFSKNVGAYYRAMNETVHTEQKIKTGGFGNNTSKNLTVNITNLGLVDRQKLLEEEFAKLQAMGDKLGYTTEEIREAQVVPEVTGKNRVVEK